MTTRSYKNNGIFKAGTANVEYSIPEDFELPSCSVEDVDRALFTLFDKHLPFTYETKKGTKRVPVIFATGERFAILRRKQPLRDRAGALVLPLVSIMRTGINQSPTMGASTNQTVPMVIKKRLTQEDQNYQRIVNKAGLSNSDDNAINYSQELSVAANGPQRAGDNRNAERLMAINAPAAGATTTAKLNPGLGNNIFEIITMPPPKYYTATYNVTYWTQYTTQMNDLIMSTMSMYQSYSQRSFKLETPKGYWFVAYAGDSLNPDNNFDDFTDNERLVRYSFDITVPAYVVGNVVPGGQSVLRRTFSAPIFQFGIETVVKDIDNIPDSNVPSGDPEDYILEDIRNTDEPLPGQAVATNSDAGTDTRGPNKNRNKEIESVGGSDSRSI